MRMTFRVLLIAAVIAGLGFGVSFGVGYAAGRGNPKQAAGGMTQQQINQLYGVQAGGVGTTGAGAAAAGTGGAAGTTRGGAGAGGAVARVPMGKITAIDGNTLTLETRAGGVQKVNLSPGTAVNKITTGSQGDLKVGDSVVATGTAKPDGSSFDATVVSQVPAELAQLVDGGGAGNIASGR